MSGDGFPSQSDGFDSRSPLQYFSGVFGHFRPIPPHSNRKTTRAKSRTNTPDRAQGQPIRLAQWLASVSEWMAHVRAPFMFCSVSPIPSLVCLQDHAPVPAIPWVTRCYRSGVFRMAFARLAVACLFVVSASSFALAQSYPPPAPGAQDPPCVPYNGLNLPVCPPGQQPACSLYTTLCLHFPMGTEQIYEIDFANAFLGVQGLELIYVSLKNKSDMADVVVVEVTLTGAPPVRKAYTLGPQERPEPIRLNDWPELAEVKGGISIVVRSDRPTAVSVAMHPQTSNLTAFWQQAKFLEGTK